MFMATLLESPNEYQYIFQDPISIRLVQVATADDVIEKTVTHPFCSLTHEREFTFDSGMVLFCKPLSPKIADHYVRLTAAFNDERNQDDEEQPMLDDQDQDEDPDDDDQVFLIIPDNKNIH